MKYAEYKYLVSSDLYRLTGKIKFGSFLLHVLFGSAFKYNFWMRTCRYAKSRPLLQYTLFPIARVMLRHLQLKLGITIPYSTKIESGFYIGHFGLVLIGAECVIGKNCNISHGVTIGKVNRGRYKGYATLGDNVYIAPGVKILGAVRIGNNVAIGANCVVTKDIPDNSVVVGIPGKVISQDGSTGYINRTDYPERIASPNKPADE